MADGQSPRLRSFGEKGYGFAMPHPVSERLDGLVDVVDGVGEVTTRKELVAALISFATPDGEELAALVHQYRLATVDQIQIAQPVSE